MDRVRLEREKASKKASRERERKGGRWQQASESEIGGGGRGDLLPLRPSIPYHLGAGQPEYSSAPRQTLCRTKAIRQVSAGRPWQWHGQCQCETALKRCHVRPLPASASWPPSPSPPPATASTLAVQLHSLYLIIGTLESSILLMSAGQRCPRLSHCAFVTILAANNGEQTL
eukprot:415141-Rhodomonas_salina.4